jgi:hypothetical protein
MTEFEKIIKSKISECSRPGNIPSNNPDIQNANFFWVGQAIGLNTALNIYKTETAKEKLFTKENILYINKLYEQYCEMSSNDEQLIFEAWFEQLNLDTL